MARPWESSLHERALQALLQHRIGLVVNLQEIGEHAHCGPGVLPASGFSYLPETLMQHSIQYLHAGWQDMGVPNLASVLKIAQMMHRAITCERRKVAVHCHSGLGRTGLVLACYMVFCGQHSAAEAIAKTRQGRPGALQTHEQAMFVHVFGCFLRQLSCIWTAGPTSSGDSKHLSSAQLWDSSLDIIVRRPCAAISSFAPAAPASLRELIARQKLLLAGTQLQHYSHVPWLLVDLLQVRTHHKDQHSVPNLNRVHMLSCTSPAAAPIQRTIMWHNIHTLQAVDVCAELTAAIAYTGAGCAACPSSNTRLCAEHCNKVPARGRSSTVSLARQPVTSC